MGCGCDPYIHIINKGVILCVFIDGFGRDQSSVFATIIGFDTKKQATTKTGIGKSGFASAGARFTQKTRKQNFSNY